MIRELALLLVLSTATDLSAMELAKVPAKLISTVETKAKKYKLVKDLDKMTNIVISDATFRIRPNNLEIINKNKKYDLNINTNLKDSVKLNFKMSF